MENQCKIVGKNNHNDSVSETREIIKPDVSDKETHGTDISGNLSLKGKTGFFRTEVIQEFDVFQRIYSLYIVLLRLPFPAFVVCMICCPVILAAIFVPIYMLDINGMDFKSEDYSSSSLSAHIESVFGEKVVRIFLFSFSLSTTLGGGAADVKSPFTLMVANLNTLCSQLVFVFLSGAVFQRLSQPVSSVRFAKSAVISDDIGEYFSEGEKKKLNKIFATRIILAGDKASVLIDAKFELQVKRYIKLPDGKSFVTNHLLELVRPNTSFLRYGMLIRHIIDEKSPLWGVDVETLKEEDAIFIVSVLALEETTMQPVFANAVYSMSDGDVEVDREFVGLVAMDSKNGKMMFDQTKLSVTKPNSLIRVGSGTIPGGNKDLLRIRSKYVNPGM